MGQKYAPLTKCIDRRYIRDWNTGQWSGMNSTVENEDFCVELDSGSSFSSFIQPLGNLGVYPESDFELQGQTNAEPQFSSYQADQQLYKQTDEDSAAELFFLRTGDDAGICTESLEIGFLNAVDTETCKIQAIGTA